MLEPSKRLETKSEISKWTGVAQMCSKVKQVQAENSSKFYLPEGVILRSTVQIRKDTYSVRSAGKRNSRELTFTIEETWYTNQPPSINLQKEKDVQEEKWRHNNRKQKSTPSRMPRIMLHQFRSSRRVNRCRGFGTWHHVRVDLRAV
jgi:hypothetical protein